MEEMNRAYLIPSFNHSAHTGLGLRDIRSLVVSVYFNVEGRTGYHYTGKVTFCRIAHKINLVDSSSWFESYCFGGGEAQEDGTVESSMALHAMSLGLTEPLI